MSAFNGAGTFVISGTGLPYVTGTTISSTVANQLNTDLATGLSTCLTKNGQTTATAIIPFALGLSSAALVDISGAAAGQIRFPATQNPSANANTLDDYEEGACPFMDASGGATVTDGGSIYTKIGRQVTVVGFLSYGLGGGATSTALNGLPYTCNSRSSCLVLGNTNQAAGLAFVPTLGTISGGFSTVTGTPTAVINSALNSTQLGFVLTYFS